MVQDSAGGTQAVERAMSLLACFSEESPELRVTELCVMTGLGQSTVSRMMSSLDRMSLVVQDSRTGIYRLGPALVTMGTIALNGILIFPASRQIAQNLAHATGLGVNVAQLHGRYLYYLCNFEGVKAPKAFSVSGSTGPLHATGLGKVLLSGMSVPEVDKYFEVPPQKYTPQTITDRGEMDAVLEEIRMNGYGTEIEELSFGRGCLAAPIRNRAGKVVAAVSISGPLSALEFGTEATQYLAGQLIEAASEISVVMGFSGSNASAVRDRLNL